MKNFNRYIFFVLIGSASLTSHNTVITSESPHNNKLAWTTSIAVATGIALGYRIYSHRRDASRRLDKITNVFLNESSELKQLTALDQDCNDKYGSVKKIAADYGSGVLQISDGTNTKYQKLFISQDQRQLPAARMNCIANSQAECVDKYIKRIEEDYKASIDPPNAPILPKFDGVPVFDRSASLVTFPGYSSVHWESGYSSLPKNFLHTLGSIGKYLGLFLASSTEYSAKGIWSVFKFAGSLTGSSLKYATLRAGSSLGYGLKSGIHSICYPADSLVRNNSFITAWPEKLEHWKRVKDIITAPESVQFLNCPHNNCAHLEQR